MRCHACKNDYTFPEFLDHARRAFRNQKWVLCGCPGCGRDYHFLLGAKTVTFGEIDGAPGPCFFPIEEFAPQDYAARWQRGLTIECEGRTWNVKCR